jgi:hypothetical protein
MHNACRQLQRGDIGQRRVNALQLTHEVGLPDAAAVITNLQGADAGRQFFYGKCLFMNRLHE